MLFALSTYSKAGYDSITKSKAVQRLSASLDAAALSAYVDQLISAFVTGRLVLEGAQRIDAVHLLVTAKSSLLPRSSKIRMAGSAWDVKQPSFGNNARSVYMCFVSRGGGTLFSVGPIRLVNEILFLNC